MENKNKTQFEQKNLEQTFYKSCVSIPLGHRKQFITISCAENTNQHYLRLKWLKLRLMMSSVCKTSGHCNFCAHALLVGALSCTNIVHSQESVGDTQMSTQWPSNPTLRLLPKRNEMKTICPQCHFHNNPQIGNNPNMYKEVKGFILM